MPAPTIDLTKPQAANEWALDLDAIRDNIAGVMMAAASAGYALPGWSTTTVGAPEYTNITMTRGVVRMRWLFTWAGGAVVQEARQYDRGAGAGYESVPLGTFTYTYDGNNNWTGTATS